MASLYMAKTYGLNLNRTFRSIIYPGPGRKESGQRSKVPVPVARTPQEELRRVLARAAADSAFIAQLTDEGSKALRGYNLTVQDKAALLSGDIKWIEARLGKLDDRLSTWLRCRLQQEIW